MSKPRRYNIREFERILKKNGYSICRNPGGSHTIWAKGTDRIAINARPNAMVMLRLIKEHNLREE